MFCNYQGHHGDKGAQIADLVFPAAAFGTKWIIHEYEGRVQESIRSTFPLGEAKENWEIIYLLANELNYDIGFKNFSELRNQLFITFQLLILIWNLSLCHLQLKVSIRNLMDINLKE